jgi:glycosyltransferase involved in cell wall biosynthesis
MTEQPLISVVTPSFNQAEFIEDTIRSVLEQDYPNWEHIVVDGGSTDGTVDILKRYPHLRWISEKDRGQGEAVNKGFRLAKGEILGWLNSDDTYRPRALSVAARQLDRQRNRYVVMGRCEFTDEAGQPTGIFHPCAYRGRRRLLQVWKGHTIPQPSVFFYKDVIERCGYVDESLYLSLDYDLFVRFSEHYWFHTVDEVLSTYRLQSGSKTLGVSEQEQLEKSVEVSRRYWGPRYSPSYWYFSRSYRASVAPIRFRANQLWNRALQAYTRQRYLACAADLLLASVLFPPLLWRRGQYPLLELVRRLMGRDRAQRIGQWVFAGSRPPEMLDGSVFADGWVSDYAVIRCQPVGVADHVEVVGEAVLSHFLNAPLRLRLSVNDRDVGEHVVSRSGPFLARFSLPQELREETALDVRIEPDKTFVPWEIGLGPDRRRLSFLLRDVRAGKD